MRYLIGTLSIVFTFSSIAFEVEGKGATRMDAVREGLINLTLNSGAKVRGYTNIENGLISGEALSVSNSLYIKSIDEIDCVGEDPVSCRLKGTLGDLKETNVLIAPVVSENSCSSMTESPRTVIECWVEAPSDIENRFGYLYRGANLTLKLSIYHEGRFVQINSKSFTLSAVGRSQEELSIGLNSVIDRQKQNWLKSRERIDFLNTTWQKAMMEFFIKDIVYGSLEH